MSDTESGLPCIVRVLFTVISPLLSESTVALISPSMMIRLGPFDASTASFSFFQPSVDVIVTVPPSISLTYLICKSLGVKPSPSALNSIL